MSVAAGAFADLNDEWRFAIQAASEKAHSLFQIVDVVCAYRVLAIGVFE
jgi:hypothetical protein